MRFQKPIPVAIAIATPTAKVHSVRPAVRRGPKPRLLSVVDYLYNLIRQRQRRRSGRNGMTIQEIKKLFAYNAWANNRVFEALSKIPETEYMRDLKSSHASLGRTMVHLVGAEKIWLSRLIGKPERSLMSLQDAPTLKKLKSTWENVAARMARFLAKLDDRNLQQEVSYTTIEGTRFSNSNQQILQHVVNHSSYHRGQIAAMMRQVGAEPVNTDLIAFFRHTAA